MAVVTVEGTEYTYDEGIVGSDSTADVLTGTDDDVRYHIRGLNQGDLLIGAGSADIIVGGYGADTLIGRAGDDILIGDHVNPQGIIVGELAGGQVLQAVSPPGSNANWKAWENYENHLREFIGSVDPALIYKLNGDGVTGQQLLDAWASYNANLTIEDVHVISGDKVQNDNGNDTAIHDLSDNLDLWETLNEVGDQTDSAAFLNFGTVGLVAAASWTNKIDTAVFSGASDNYTITVGPQFVSVQDNVDSDGFDTLFGVEHLEFADQTLAISWFTKAASVPAVQFDTLTAMYIAYFDRAPDVVGLCYWSSRLSEGMSLQEIARSFFVQPETQAALPANQSTESFVTEVYHNVLGRAPDAPGLNYWVHDLQVGNVRKDEFMLAVIYGAQSSSGGPADAQYLANKNAVGMEFAMMAGLNDADWAQSVMHNVDGTVASVAAAQQLIEHFSATAATAAGSHLVVELIGIGALAS